MRKMQNSRIRSAWPVATGTLAATAMFAVAPSSASAGELLLGDVNGVLAVYKGDSEGNPSYFQIQSSTTNEKGAQFDVASPYDGYFNGQGQYAFDLHLLVDPTYTPDDYAPLTPTYKAESEAGSSGTGPAVAWAINDYKPGGPTNPSSTVSNTPLNAESGLPLSSLPTFTGLDLSDPPDGGADLLTSGSVGLNSDGFIHWFDLSNDPDAPDGRTMLSLLGPLPNGEFFTGEFRFEFENALETSDGDYTDTEGDEHDIDYFTLSNGPLGETDLISRAQIFAITAPAPTAAMTGLISIGGLLLGRRRRRSL